MGGFVYDSSGSHTMDWAFPRYDRLDEMDEAHGDALEGLEGGKIEDVLVVWDAKKGAKGGWEFDFPTILRLDKGDVAVDVISGMRAGIAYERIDTEAPVTVYGCDTPGAHEEFDHLYDLSWRTYAPLEQIVGCIVEQFYWRADDALHPIALGCRLDSGEHLRIGGTFNETEPTLVNPLAPDGDALFDDVILPLKYRKPAAETPVVTDVWEPESIPYRILSLDKSWMEHGCKRDAHRHCIFIGGLALSCAIEQTRPPSWRGVGIRETAEEVPTDFLLGRMAEIV